MSLFRDKETGFSSRGVVGGDRVMYRVIRME